MIYEALLAPRETPHTLREIKRALLTYDKVVLIDPSDRDIIPSNAFMSTILGVPLLGIDTGPVRPLGKSLNYDVQFSKIIDSTSKIMSEGLIEVRSTYQKTSEDQLTIGTVLTGGYPLNTQFVFWLYRSMASDSRFLSDAMPDAPFLVNALNASHQLALPGVGDGEINDIPALPMLDGDDFSTDIRQSLTNIARSRIASFIKYSGYCEAKSLVPVFSSAAYGQIAQRLLNNASEALSLDDEDRYWSKRNRVLELCHEEYLMDDILDHLSVDDVVKLRTVAWGRQAKARENLFQSVYLIAQEAQDAANFVAKVTPLIQTYRRESEELIRERERLAFELKCDIGSATLAGGTALVGLLSQLESPVASIGVTLAAGGMWAFDKAKGYVPALRELRAQEDELKRGAGFGLHNFYSRLRG